MKPTNKLLYHITPFLIIELYLFFLSITMLITDGNSWGSLIGMLGLFLTAVLIMVDYLLKRIFKKYKKTFITEAIIIGLIFIWYFVSLQ